MKMIPLKKIHKHIIDRVGHKYGQVTVLSYAGKCGDGAVWNCVCDCGTRCLRSSKSFVSAERLNYVVRCSQKCTAKKKEIIAPPKKILKLNMVMR